MRRSSLFLSAGNRPATQHRSPLDTDQKPFRRHCRSRQQRARAPRRGARPSHVQPVAAKCEVAIGGRMGATCVRRMWCRGRPGPGGCSGLGSSVGGPWVSTGACAVEETCQSPLQSHDTTRNRRYPTVSGHDPAPASAGRGYRRSGVLTGGQFPARRNLRVCNGRPGRPLPSRRDRSEPDGRCRGLPRSTRVGSGHVLELDVRTCGGWLEWPESFMPGMLASRCGL